MWLEPEKFYVSRAEFVTKMSEYPLSHFLMTSTFRKMIALRVSDSPSKIKKKMSQFEESKDGIRDLKSQSKPNLK